MSSEQLKIKSINRWLRLFQVQHMIVEVELSISRYLLSLDPLIPCLSLVSSHPPGTSPENILPENNR